MGIFMKANGRSQRCMAWLTFFFLNRTRWGEKVTPVNDYEFLLVLLGGMLFLYGKLFQFIDYIVILAHLIR